MFYLIENKLQLQHFEDKGYNEVFLQVIPYNFNYHPKLSPISLIYLRPMNGDQGFMMCINHDQSFSLSINQVIQTLSKIDKIYVINKKDALYYIPFEKQLYDLKLLDHSLNIQYSSLYNFYYNKFNTKSDLNKIIPISKHFEVCENTFELVRKVNVSSCDLKWYKYYNNYFTQVYYFIEAVGLRADMNLLDTYLNPTYRDFSIKDGKVLSHYNLYNSTSRPSNSFNNINFNALNKSDGCRNTFIPENDYLLEMDFESFHIRILGHLVRYEFTENNIHEYLGQQYFNVKSLTPAQYKKSKEMTFKIIYNDWIDKYQHIELFAKIKHYKDQKWEEYQQNGVLMSDISGKPITGIKKKTQLLPFILHNYETESNVIKLYKILQLLSEQKSSLILYNFDSITLDFCKEDEYLLPGIKDILEENGKYPVKQKMGNSLNFE